MPTLHGRHNASLSVQQELRALWESVDKLTKQESRLRRAIAGVAGGPADDGGTAAAGGGYATIVTPVGGPLEAAPGDNLTLEAEGDLEISGDAGSDTLTFTNTGPSKGFVIAMAAAL